MNIMRAVSVLDLDAEDLSRVLHRARSFRDGMSPSDGAHGAHLVAFFEQPSTRTRLSLHTAMIRMGGVANVIPTDETALMKEESIEDTMCMASEFADLVVLRHHDNEVVKAAAKAAYVPFMNAGNGTDEHPTQGWGDMATIKEGIETKRLPKRPLRVLFLGANRGNRTSRSLSLGLACLGPQVGIEVEKAFYIGPSGQGTPESDILDAYRRAGIETVCFEGRPGALSHIVSLGAHQVDVVYLNRTRKEHGQDWLPSPVTIEELLPRLPERSGIMHPLPRVEELPRLIDADPRAWYMKREVKNVLCVRMSFIELALERARKH